MGSWEKTKKTRPLSNTRARTTSDAGQPRGEPPGVGLSLRRGMRSAYEVWHGDTPEVQPNNMIDLSFS
jgi:hypothetical protein